MDTSKTDKQLIADLSKAFADNLTDDDKTKAKNGGAICRLFNGIRYQHNENWITTKSC